MFAMRSARCAVRHHATATRAVLGTLLVSLLPFAAMRAQDTIVCGQCTEWNVRQRPIRLHGNTYYVGTHGLGVQLSRQVVPRGVDIGLRRRGVLRPCLGTVAQMSRPGAATQPARGCAANGVMKERCQVRLRRDARPLFPRLNFSFRRMVFANRATASS